LLGNFKDLTSSDHKDVQMITIRHIERLFSDQNHRRLYRELIAGRPEATFALDGALARVVPISALGMIRLDELSQSHTSLYRRLLNVVLTAQQADGGWGDPLVSALCVRALLCGGGQGAAVERGLRYLAGLQQPHGTWPREPLRRMPMDAFATAFILMQLGDREPFRRAVNFDDACNWFAANHKTLEAETRRLWSHAAVRCRHAADRDALNTLYSAGRTAAA
jgi:hypothetical protein